MARTCKGPSTSRTSGQPRVRGFPPIADAGARVLILGTMPSAASLRARQYYAHPQNAFWRIAGAILGFDAASAYAARKSFLRANDIALWDVLRSCAREGSLDSAIDARTIVPNDFRRFFRAHPLVTRVCFNGARAAELFARHVQPGLPAPASLEYLRLPSTSPANASVPWKGKLRAWKAIRLTPEDST